MMNLIKSKTELIITKNLTVHKKRQYGIWETRTPDLEIMRLTRYRLRQDPGLTQEFFLNL